MMNLVDDFLNNITMYRLVLYFLIILAVVGLIYSMFGVIAMDPIAYIFSFTFLLFAGFVANWFFAKAFDVAAEDADTDLNMSAACADWLIPARAATAINKRITFIMTSNKKYYL